MLDTIWLSIIVYTFTAGIVVLGWCWIFTLPANERRLRKMIMAAEFNEHRRLAVRCGRDTLECGDSVIWLNGVAINHGLSLRGRVQLPEYARFRREQLRAEEQRKRVAWEQQRAAAVLRAFNHSRKDIPDEPTYD